MDLIYLSSSGEGVLVLSVRLSVSVEGISRLLGFLIFNSDSGLTKGLKIRVMGKDHLTFKEGK